MEFFKYHGTGNDFILLDHEPEDPSTLAKKMCDRHFGIGADGLIFPAKSDLADIRFHYYNSDGSIAPMCGNGMRCFVRFLYDQKIMQHQSFVVETLAGLIPVKHDLKSGIIEVNLGKPTIVLDYPHVKHRINALEPTKIILHGITLPLYTIFLGTLHTIVFMEDAMDIKELGPAISNHPFFPEQTNVNFVKVIHESKQMVTTFERGAGWTLSCGTGSAASAYMSSMLKKTKGIVETHVPGGILYVDVDQDILLKGPALRIAKGWFDETTV